MPVLDTDVPSPGLRRIFLAVLLIQGIHVIEHLVQLVQTYVWHVPADRALGLLGWIFQFHGTAEWLHLVFNAALLTCVLWIQPEVSRVAGRRRGRAFAALACGVGTWHVVEHMLIVGNLIAHGGGCPCPGIIRFVPDVVLHMGYNAVVYGGILLVAAPIMRRPAPIQTIEPLWLRGRRAARETLAS